VDLFKFWFGLPRQDLLRLLLPAALLILATVLPGRRVARAAAFGVAIALPFLRPLDTPTPLTAAWSALWLIVAWQVGLPAPGNAPAPARRSGALESGAVGLLVGVALMLLMVASLARQDLEPTVGRRVVMALLLIGIGVVHLMLRGHVRRAAIAFGALGLGLQVLDGVARGAELAGSAPARGGVWLATALAIALVLRLGMSRERFAGSPWVSDAHDLHD
jgi:hypothetical protein